MTNANDSSRKAWSGSFIYTFILIGLIIASIHGTSVLLALALLVAVAGMAGIVHAVFPGGRFFMLVFANSLALYACAAIFVVETAYPTLSDTAAALGFLLPLAGFIVGALIRRRQINELIAAAPTRAERSFRPMVKWTAPLAAIAVAPYLLPAAVVHGVALEIVYLGVCAALGLLAFVGSRDIAVFMIGTGLLFRDFFDTVSRLAKPAYAFFTFYVFVLVVFACLYTIAD
ncbi:MAG: hypothetical protein MJE12_00315, partial [Alphaproteobacteria bacterium]|nr:hypothetical protein [Alphaproteobacteria bacterium]